MRKLITGILVVALMFSGCATSSKNIASSYTSPMQYQSYDCEQLSAESQRVHTRVNQLTGRLDKAATNDKWITGAGVLLFWPALFALGGTQAQETEYAKLKGEYDAIHQSAVIRKCSSVVHSPIEVENDSNNPKADES